MPFHKDFLEVCTYLICTTLYKWSEKNPYKRQAKKRSVLKKSFSLVVITLVLNKISMLNVLPYNVIWCFQYWQLQPAALKHHYLLILWAIDTKLNIELTHISYHFQSKAKKNIHKCFNMCGFHSMKLICSTNIESSSGTISSNSCGNDISLPTRFPTMSTSIPC